MPKPRFSTLPLYLALAGFAAIAGFSVFAGLLPGPAGQDRPRTVSQAMRTLVDNVTGHYSGDEILMGLRKWSADLDDTGVTLHGAAITFLDRKDPATFMPYAFALDSSGFTAPRPDQMPDIAAFFAREKADFSALPVPRPTDCIQTRSETLPGTVPVCRLAAMRDGGPPAVIGLVRPADTALPLADGDATCRAEVARWLALPEFKGVPLALCAVVDRPYVPDAYSAGMWMDVIFYQKRGTRLLNMRGEARNFHRI